MRKKLENNKTSKPSFYGWQLQHACHELKPFKSKEELEFLEAAKVKYLSFIIDDFDSVIEKITGDFYQGVFIDSLLTEEQILAIRSLQERKDVSLLKEFSNDVNVTFIANRIHERNYYSSEAIETPEFWSGIEENYNNLIKLIEEANS